MTQVTITHPSTGKTYTITTDHAASSYGIPVVLEDGQLIDFSELRGYDYNSDASDSAGEGRTASPADETYHQMLALIADFFAEE